MLKDTYGRQINYLRISVTQRCNFRCQYCMPNTPFSWQAKENLLSFEELFIFAKVAIDNGINKIRLTGGEPLLRQDIDKFIKMLHDYKPDLDLALTTNAYFLEKMADKLKKNGLKRINISLDSLKEQSALKISQKNILSNVLKGIYKAKEVGLKIKLNCVPLKGINDQEVLDLLEFAMKNDFEIRFIEYMENSYANVDIKGLNDQELLEIIGSKYTFEKIERQGSAQRYKLENGKIFGIINPHKHDFCQSCNRIRLNAEGMLIPCLYFDEAMSIKEAVKNKDIKKAAMILEEILKNKPEKNKWEEQNNQISSRAFYETGG